MSSTAVQVCRISSPSRRRPWPEVPTPWSPQARSWQSTRSWAVRVSTRSSWQVTMSLPERTPLEISLVSRSSPSPDRARSALIQWPADLALPRFWAATETCSTPWTAGPTTLVPREPPRTCLWFPRPRCWVITRWSDRVVMTPWPLEATAP